MSPTNRHKYKYFHSTVQRAKDRRQKFHFCRLPFDVRPRNVKLNLSNTEESPQFPITKIYPHLACTCMHPYMYLACTRMRART